MRCYICNILTWHWCYEYVLGRPVCKDKVGCALRVVCD